MAKELNISRCRALTRIFVLVSGLLFLSSEAFALIHSSESGAENLVTSTESHSYTYCPNYDRKTETVVKDGATLKSRTFTYDETYWVKTVASNTVLSASQDLIACQKSRKEYHEEHF